MRVLFIFVIDPLSPNPVCSEWEEQREISRKDRGLQCLWTTGNLRLSLHLQVFAVTLHLHVTIYIPCHQLLSTKHVTLSTCVHLSLSFQARSMWTTTSPRTSPVSPVTWTSCSTGRRAVRDTNQPIEWCTEATKEEDDHSDRCLIWDHRWEAEGNLNIVEGGDRGNTAAPPWQQIGLEMQHRGCLQEATGLCMLRNLRTFNLCSKMLQIFYLPVVAICSVLQWHQQTDQED